MKRGCSIKGCRNYGTLVAVIEAQCPNPAPGALPVKMEYPDLPHCDLHAALSELEHLVTDESWRLIAGKFREQGFVTPDRATLRLTWRHA
jgi:hypothetical protein